MTAWAMLRRVAYNGPGVPSQKRWKLLSRMIVGADDNPMLVRWRLLQTPWFGLYLHFIYREDMDPIPHDHPWVFWRLVLRGAYRERYWTDPSEVPPVDIVWRRRGDISRFPVEHAHYIDTVRPGTTTLVLTGRKQRVWGFWPSDAANGFTNTGEFVSVDPATRKVRLLRRRWVDYRDALNLRPNEGVK